MKLLAVNLFLHSLAPVIKCWTFLPVLDSCAVASSAAHFHTAILALPLHLAPSHSLAPTTPKLFIITPSKRPPSPSQEVTHATNCRVQANLFASYICVLPPSSLLSQREPRENTVTCRKTPENESFDVKLQHITSHLPYHFNSPAAKKLGGSAVRFNKQHWSFRTLFFISESKPWKLVPIN